MPMYNLIEYSDYYSKTPGILSPYYGNKPFLDNNRAIADFPASDRLNNNKKKKIAHRTGNRKSYKNVKIRVPLKCLSTFWRNLEMHLNNHEINIILTLSERCFLIDALLFIKK